MYSEYFYHNQNDRRIVNLRLILVAAILTSLYNIVGFYSIERLNV